MDLKNIAVIGGDRRTAYMIPRLSKEGFCVRCCGTVDIIECRGLGVRTDSLRQAIADADVIAAGIPFLRNGNISSEEKLPGLALQNLIEWMQPGRKFFAGVIPEDFAARCRESGVGCFDFMRHEPLAVFNSIATAEGALLEAIRNQETNLHRSRALVLGYGRCGSVLAGKLRGLDARVTVCCRRENDLARAETCGMDALPLSRLKESIHSFEYIFNTIPSVILDSEALRNLRGDALVLDLASAPGGADREAARALGIRLLQCPGLPGKYAAKTSGDRLAAYVIETVKKGRKHKP